jgi:PKD repeat protein
MKRSLFKYFFWALLFSATTNMAVAQICSPSFTYIKKQKEVHFTNTSFPSTGLEHFYWLFGDGSPLQKDPFNTPVVHTYGLPGTYIVALFDSLCPSLTKKVDTIVVSATGIFQPSFTATPGANGQYTFNDLTTPAQMVKLRHWDFGDQSSESIANPSHTYHQNGSYTVCLYVGDSNNNFDVTCKPVVVNNVINCKANFVAEYVNGRHQFYNYSSTDDTTVSYLWKFGDGQTSSEKHPTHQYYGSGNVDVTLLLRGTTCNDSFTTTLWIPDTNQCQLLVKTTISNQRVTFILADKTPLPIAQYYIDYGDGTTAYPTSNIIEHIYPGIGRYPIQVTTIGSVCGIELTVRDTVNITSEIAICKASFDATSKNFAVSLYNNSYVYGSSSGSSVVIKWGDGSSYTGPDSVNYFHAYTTEGLYPISLTINNPGGCSDSITKIIGVGPTYRLSGGITAGNDPADFATVIIYAYEPLNGTLTPYTYTSTNNDGSYLIDLPKGYYLLQADFAFNPRNATFYLPTYYRNKLNWDNSDVITLNTNRNDIDINLIPFNYEENGFGGISGKILYGTGVGNNDGQIPAGAPVNKMLVFLLDENGKAVAYNHSNAEGRFDFSKLPLGNYKVWAEMAGKVTTPAEVSITSQKSTVTGVNIIVGKNTVTTSVSKSTFTEQNWLKLYPNPASQFVHLSANDPQSSIASISIYDSNGRLVLSSSPKQENDVTIDLSAFTNGLYSIHIMNTNGFVSKRKFIKTDN